MDKPVEVKLRGKARKVHPHEALLHGLFAAVVQGRPRAMKQFLRECGRAGLLDPEVAQLASVIHVPNDLPPDLAGYILMREGPPPWDKATLTPYLADYDRDSRG